jgi:hypothetical protein
LRLAFKTLTPTAPDAIDNRILIQQCSVQSDRLLNDIYPRDVINMASTISAKKRKAIQHWHVFVMSVAANTTALLLRGDFDRGADAAILYGPMTAYIKTQAGNFLNPTIPALTPIILPFLDLIPFSIILLVGAVASWQAYSGYQSYERDDLAGMGKCGLNVLVLVALLFVSAKITDVMVT